MGKSKRQLADEAYMRSMETLAGRAPVPEGVLVGQLGIDGSVAGTSGMVIPHPIKGVPEHCPGCDANMIIVYGGSWTPMYVRCSDETDAPLAGETCKLQCAYCSRIVVVTPMTWQAVKDERRRTIGRSDAHARAVSQRGTKTRGAG
jgi:hypothetical protein